MIEIVRARITDLDQQLYLKQNCTEYFSQYSIRDLKDMIAINKRWLMVLCDTDPCKMQ